MNICMYGDATADRERLKRDGRFLLYSQGAHKCAIPGRIRSWWNDVSHGDAWLCGYCNKEFWCNAKHGVLSINYPNWTEQI